MSLPCISHNLREAARERKVAAGFTDCVKSPPVGFVLVLVLDFSGIFEDEDENEDENDGAVVDFSHSLFSPSHAVSG